jgi:hypothetical protein
METLELLGFVYLPPLTRDSRGRHYQEQQKKGGAKQHIAAAH